MCGRGAIYLDVQGNAGFHSCFHPDHPGSKRDDVRWRLETFRIAKKHIGAVATENGPYEFAIQDIDLGAYPHIKNGNAANLKPIPSSNWFITILSILSADRGIAGFTEWNM